MFYITIHATHSLHLYMASDMDMIVGVKDHSTRKFAHAISWAILSDVLIGKSRQQGRFSPHTG